MPPTPFPATARAGPTQERTQEQKLSVWTFEDRTPTYGYETGRAGSGISRGYFALPPPGARAARQPWCALTLCQPVMPQRARSGAASTLRRGAPSGYECECQRSSAQHRDPRLRAWRLGRWSRRLGIRRRLRSCAHVVASGKVAGVAGEAPARYSSHLFGEDELGDPLPVATQLSIFSFSAVRYSQNLHGGKSRE
jgi:hypothetical protein